MCGIMTMTISVCGEIMYYGYVCIAVLLFGAQFLTKRDYAKKMGSGLFPTMLLTLLGGILSAIIMAFTSGFVIEITPFTLIMAFISSLNGFLFNLCSLKAFERVNLAVYSVYSMLGGMILPIIAGVAFFDEELSAGLILCCVFIFTAIVLVNVKKHSSGKGGSFVNALFYLGVFTFNGMSGVINKLYSAAAYEKASSAGFSMLCSVVTVALSFIFVAVLWKKRTKIYAPATLLALCGNAGNRVGNYLLLLSLAVLPASVNYSMVTGGTIVVSSVLSSLTGNKVHKYEWLAVASSAIGIACLILI